MIFVTHKSTIILVISLSIIILGLAIFRFVFKSSVILTPTPSPTLTPLLPLKIQSLPETVATPQQLIIDPSLNQLQFPSSAPVYTFTQPSLTPDQFTNLALRLGIDSTVRTINDPIQGVLLQTTSGQKILQAKTTPLTITYTNIGSFPPSSSKFPADSSLIASLAQITSRMSPEINFQPQINQKHYLQVSQGNLISASETTAHILEVNLTPKIDSFVIISTTSNTFPSYAHFNKQGQLLSLEIIPFTPSPLATYPLKNLSAVVSNFSTEATLIYYDRFDSTIKPPQMIANQINLAYLLITHDPANKLLIPVYLVQGTITLNQITYSATAVTPAIDPNYLLEP